jgi:hypothetical protein
LLLSLGFHVLAGALLVVASRPGAARENDGWCVVDTVVRHPGPEAHVDLVLDDPAQPLPPMPVRIIDPPPVPHTTAVTAGPPVSPLSPNRSTPAETTARGQSPGAARQPAASPGPGTAMDLFPVEAGCKTVVYVIDRSGSMGLNGGLAVAKLELLASLDHLGPEVRFQVILYNRSSEPLLIGGRTDLVPATPENKRQVTRYLTDLEADGATRHEQALHRALVLRPDVIFFLTDAEDLGDDEIRAVTQMNHSHTAIHAVRLTSSRHNQDDTPLRTLALANHGTYRTLVLSP